MEGGIAPAAPAPRRYAFEFRGKGSEYFRIWIVNLALTIVTLGIYSAWAKVRTRRYFYGNTFVGGHAFEYHASPLRILIGRLIAVALFLGYEVSAILNPIYASPWLLVAGFGLPWLVNTSLRFNARNSSYRNVRFNFEGRYFEALVAYVLWPIGGFATLGALIPAARRARDYFYTNNHTYGGRPFRTDFTAGQIYLVFGIALLVALILFGLCGAAGWYVYHHYWSLAFAKLGMGVVIAIEVAVWFVVWFIFVSIAPAIHTMIVNLSLNHTTLDERHRLCSEMSPVKVAWITVTNAILTLVTLGLFYPWAKVRLTRYEIDQLSAELQGDIDAYASEALATQSAVGEEIGSFFSFDFGL